MKTRSIAEYLASHPFFAGLDGESVRELAGCARNEHVRAGGYLFREGGTAEHFYVIMHGRVALELYSPGSGAHVLDSAGEGEVLDWPWLIPPHRWFWDARAVEPTSVVSMDSACLRGKCDADPRLGYDLVQRVAQVMSHRLQADPGAPARPVRPPMTPDTAIQARPAASRPRAGPPMIPRPFRVVSNHPDTPDTVTLTLEPADGVPLGFAPGQFTMIGTFGAGEVPISISGDPAGGPLVQTIRDVGGVSHSLARAADGDVLTVRGPYGTGWNVADGAGGDLVIVAGGIGLAPLRSVAPRGAGQPGRLRPGHPAVRRPHPGRAAVPRRAGRLGLTGASRWTSRWTGARRAGPGRVGLVTALIPGRPARPGAHPGAGLRARGDDAVRGGRAARRRAAGETGSGCRWNATWPAASACAGTASSASSSSAPMARCSATTSWTGC